MSLICTSKYNKSLINTGHPDGFTVLELRKIARVLGINSVKRGDICEELVRKKYTKELILQTFENLNPSSNVVGSEVFGGEVVIKKPEIVQEYDDKYISEYNIGGNLVLLPEIITTPIEKYNHTSLSGTPDTSLSYKNSTFEQIQCGLNLNTFYPIQNVLCNALAGESFDSFLAGKGCRNMSNTISNNLVRVASQRIFADPTRSLLEPISNSIDAYRKLKGCPEIGKFGMGFFSILYWLTHPNDYIIINTTYQILDTSSPLSGRFCHWKSKIIFKDNGYHFVIYDSSILVGSDLKTGTTITIYTEEEKFKNFGIYKAIYNAFSNVKDVSIVWSDVNPKFENGEFLFQNVEPIVNYEKIRETIFIAANDKCVQYHDYAIGIDIHTYVTSMLIPTISTKIPETKIGYRQSSKIIEDGDNELLITVGDIIILNIIDIPSYFSSIYSKKSAHDRKYYNYVLSLPSNNPMPVSRDDVILDNPVFFEIAMRELFHLVELSILGGNIETLFRLFYIYSDRNNSPPVYKLVNLMREYIQNHSKVFLIPRGYNQLYKSISKKLKNYYFVESDLPDYNKLKNFILSKFESHDNYIVNHKVISLKMSGDKVTNGGVSDLLFVDQSLKDTYRILQEARPLILSTTKEKLPGFYTNLTKTFPKDDMNYDRFNTLVEAVRVLEFKDNLNRSSVEYLIMYCLGIFNTLKNFTKSEKFYSEYNNLIYTMFIRIVNRSVPYTNNNKTNVTVNTYPYVAGRYTYPIINGLKFKLLDVRDESILNYMIKYASIITNAISSFDKHIIVVRDCFAGHIFLYIGQDNEVFNFIINLHPIYSYYFSMIYHLWYKRIKNNQLLPLLNYVYYELSNKYNIGTLLSSVAQICTIDIIESEKGVYSIIDNINSSLDIYSKILNNGMIMYNPPKVSQNIYGTSFSGSQLIGYLFSNDINSNDINWIFSIKDYPKTTGKFKIYEIAINDGTTKSFGNSVITELLQNSIDAIRSLNNKIGKINLETTKIDQTNVISMKDTVGIPLPGIISILIPFLSTKVSKSELVTGEMGTGFMNVFRQPYAKRIEIYTTDPNTGLFYYLTLSPVVSENRVIDIDVVFRVSNERNEKGTTVSIVLNEMDSIKRSTVLSEVSIFANNNFAVASLFNNIPIEFNGIERKINFIKIYENEYANAYMTVNENIKITSSLLTNGIPFSDLEPIAKMLWNNKFNWLAYVYSSGIFINLKKNKYKPVQSRKDIIMDENDKNILRALINLACNIRICQRIGNEDLDDYFFPGINYIGPMDQTMPNLVKTDDLYYTGRNIAESVMKNIGIEFSISEIIRNIVKDLKQKQPTPDNVAEEIKKYKELPMGYRDSILKWFSNKKGKTEIKESVVLGIGDGTSQVPTNIKSTINFDPNKAKNIMFLIDKMVKHVYNWWKDIFKNKNERPAILYVDDLGSMEGVYISSGNTIKISLKSLNIQNYDIYAKNYLDLFRQNRENATIYFINNKELNSILGSQTVAPTIIHELGHAITRGDHSTGYHGDIHFTIKKEKYKFPFDRGCCEIWERAMRNFNPLD